MNGVPDKILSRDRTERGIVKSDHVRVIALHQSQKSPVSEDTPPSPPTLLLQLVTVIVFNSLSSFTTRVPAF